LLFRALRFAHELQVHDWTPTDRTKAAYVARNPHAGGTAALVVDMAKRLEGRAHTIIMDNYFTSPKAFQTLFDLGFHAVGTLKSRSGVPKWLLWGKKQSGRPAGTAHFLRSTDGKLLVQEWQDSGLVRVMSTGHVGYGGLPATYANKPGVESIGRWRKGDTQWQRAEFPCPPAVVFYQKHMRGVDMCDAVRAISDCVNCGLLCFVRRNVLFTRFAKSVTAGIWRCSTSMWIWP
jgi:hypothetical protein